MYKWKSGCFEWVKQPLFFFLKKSLLEEAFSGERSFHNKIKTKTNTKSKRFFKIKKA